MVLVPTHVPDKEGVERYTTKEGLDGKKSIWTRIRGLSKRSERLYKDTRVREVDLRV